MVNKDRGVCLSFGIEMGISLDMLGDSIGHYQEPSPCMNYEVLDVGSDDFSGSSARYSLKPRFKGQAIKDQVLVGVWEICLFQLL
jgi:hypothetical protein